MKNKKIILTILLLPLLLIIGTVTFRMYEQSLIKKSIGASNTIYFDKVNNGIISAPKYVITYVDKDNGVKLSSVTIKNLLSGDIEEHGNYTLFDNTIDKDAKEKFANKKFKYLKALWQENKVNIENIEKSNKNAEDYAKILDLSNLDYIKHNTKSFDQFSSENIIVPVAIDYKDSTEYVKNRIELLETNLEMTSEEQDTVNKLQSYLNSNNKLSNNEFTYNNEFIKKVANIANFERFIEQNEENVITRFQSDKFYYDNISFLTISEIKLLENDDFAVVANHITTNFEEYPSTYFYYFSKDANGAYTLTDFVLLNAYG